MHARCEKGVSMIELVIVVALTSLVAGLITGLVTRPMEGYRDLALRTTLVDAAESAIQRMARDVRAALPNSLRISADSRSLELIHTVDGARYRALPGVNPSTADHTAASDWLDFSGDAQFNILGRFSFSGFSYGTPLAAGSRLAVYPTSATTYAQAAAGSNPGVITPSSTSVTISDDVDEDQITLSGPFQFQFSSPRQRLYVVDTPVSYLCNLGSGRLTRYAGYGFAAAQPTDPAIPPLTGAGDALVTDHVSACQFSYTPGTPSRAGLLTIALTLSEGVEQVRLLHQVHVESTP
jgi:MSHA biogenesis protein MshO